MILIDYFKYFISKIFRNKSNIYFIIIMVISTIVLLISISFRNNLNNYINYSIYKNIGFRTLNVSCKQNLEDFGVKELSNIEHIEDVYSSAYDSITVESSFANDNLNGNISLTYASSAIPEDVLETKFDENDRNIAIIPINFYPDTTAYDLNINEDYVINGNDLLGKKFTVTYYTYIIEGMNLKPKEELSKTFTIIGVYDNTKVMNSNNQIYVPLEDIKEIMNATIPENSEGTLFYALNVIVDDINNIEYVKQEITKLGFFNVDNVMKVDTDLINTIEISCSAINIIVLIAIIFITIFYVKKKISNESKMIGTLRAIGYNKKITNNIYILEVIFINLLAYFIGALIFSIVYFGIKNIIFSSLIYIGFKITLQFLSFIIVFIIIVLISSFVAALNIYEKSKLDIIYLLGSEE